MTVGPTPGSNANQNEIPIKASRSRIPYWIQDCYYSCRGDSFKILKLNKAILKNRQEEAIHLIQTISLKNIHKKDDLGLKPVFLAVDYNRLLVVSAFLEKGMNEDEVNKDGMTLLGYAARRGCVGITKLFIEKGFNVNKQDRFGLTPVGHAILSQKVAVIPILIEGGVDLDKEDSSGKVPLHYGLGGGSVEVSRVFVERMSWEDLNKPRSDGVSLVEYVRSCSEFSQEKKGEIMSIIESRRPRDV